MGSDKRNEKIAFYEESIEEFSKIINESFIALEVMIEDADVVFGRGSEEFDALQKSVVNFCRLKTIDFLQFIASVQ